MDTPRVCATCKHFEFRQGTEGYSEYTPGSDASFECGLTYWQIDGGDCTEDEFRSTMLAALICDKYEPIEVTPITLNKPAWEREAEAIAALDAKYPACEFKIEENRIRTEFRASYNVGYGWTLSRLFRDKLEAIAWLDECVAKAVEEAHAVPTD